MGQEQPRWQSCGCPIVECEELQKQFVSGTGDASKTLLRLIGSLPRLCGLEMISSKRFSTATLDRFIQFSSLL
jgi:hypothetical protein